MNKAITLGFVLIMNVMNVTTLLAQSNIADTLLVSNEAFTAWCEGGIGTEKIYYQGNSFLPGDAEATTLQGLVLLEFPAMTTAESYSHRLDSVGNIVQTSLTAHGVDMLRELFVNDKPQVVVYHIEVAEGSKLLNFSIRLFPSLSDTSFCRERTLLTQYSDSVSRYETMLYATTDQGGAVVADRDALRVVNATEVTLYLVAGTRAIPTPSTTLKRDHSAIRLHRDLWLKAHRASLKSYSRLRSKHVRRHC